MRVFQRQPKLILWTRPKEPDPWHQTMGSIWMQRTGMNECGGEWMIKTNSSSQACEQWASEYLKFTHTESFLNGKSHSFREVRRIHVNIFSLSVHLPKATLLNYHDAFIVVSCWAHRLENLMVLYLTAMGFMFRQFTYCKMGQDVVTYTVSEWYAQIKNFSIHKISYSS